MKFRYRLMIGILIILCMSFCVGGLILMKYSYEYSYGEETKKCEQNFVSIQNTIKIALEASSDNNVDTIKGIVKEIDAGNSGSYYGLKLVNSTTKEEIFTSDNSNDFTDVNVDKDNITTIYLKKDDSYYYQISGCITIGTDDNHQLLQMYVSYDITDVYSFRERQMQLYRKVMIVQIVAGIIISFLYAFMMTRPIEQLSRVVKRISRGNYSYRASIKSGDEVEQLAQDINIMADRIEDNMNELIKSVENQEQFMGSFAHEMKTPMTSIIGYADLLRSRDMEYEEIKEAANYIFSEGKRLEALSSKMLELIVLNNEDVMLFEQDPRSVISDVARMLKFYLKEKNIELKVNCQKSRVMMDKDLFKSLISNLCDNAAKAIDNGGVITITGKLENGMYVIKITDNGRGMTKDELDRITKAFYRVDKSRSRAQGGAGLGLSICQRIVGLHNGDMTFDSEMGRGTVVKLTFKEAANESM